MQSQVNIPSATISSSKVEGTDVFNFDGDSLGSIDDLIIDKATGQVHYAVLEFGGVLGLGTDHYPLPWGMLRYDVVKDGYVVDLEKEQLSDAPRYPKGSAPAYTDEYGRGVYEHYGTPWIR